MLHSIKHSAVQFTAVALLTACAVLSPFAMNAIAAPAGAGADRGQQTWYTVPSDEDSCFSSPGSINHTPCANSGN
jgi:hypothetical protein